jgi:hypothetical protein
MRLNRSSLKKLGCKQCGRPSNTWCDNDCRQAQQNFHMVLNPSHPKKMYKMASKKYCMIIWHKKRSHLEHKQKDLHLLLESDPKILWKSFEEIDYCTKIYTLGQSINDHFVLVIQVPNDLQGGNMDPYERPSKSPRPRMSMG